MTKNYNLCHFHKTLWMGTLYHILPCHPLSFCSNHCQDHFRFNQGSSTMTRPIFSQFCLLLVRLGDGYQIDTDHCWKIIGCDIGCWLLIQWQYLLHGPCFTKVISNAVHFPLPQAYSCNWKPFFGWRHGQTVATVSFPVLSLYCQSLSNCWGWSTKA